jgi:hypothetical protein
MWREGITRQVKGGGETLADMWGAEWRKSNDQNWSAKDSERRHCTWGNRCRAKIGKGHSQMTSFHWPLKLSDFLIGNGNLQIYIQCKGSSKGWKWAEQKEEGHFFEQLIHNYNGRINPNGEVGNGQWKEKIVADRLKSC